jgi:hypothetical protein
METELKVALVISVAPTLASIAALVVELQNKKSVKEVHKLANSNLKRVTVSLVKANDKIEKLQELITKMVKKSGHDMLK